MFRQARYTSSLRKMASHLILIVWPTRCNTPYLLLRVNLIVHCKLNFTRLGLSRVPPYPFRHFDCKTSHLWRKCPSCLALHSTRSVRAAEVMPIVGTPARTTRTCSICLRSGFPHESNCWCGIIRSKEEPKNRLVGCSYNIIFYSHCEKLTIAASTLLINRLRPTC